ncbi:MAG: hypothetical protein JWM31_2788 [Solirubrobacterales bacterium]|nr:hypothetical protein [Solirubrobacterales bacterium]
MADQSAPTPAQNVDTAATKTTPTVKRATAATKRSTSAKKAATTRKANSTTATAKSTARTTAKKVAPEPSTVDQVQAYAEKAVLIPVGAALLARDRVTGTIDDLTAKYGSKEAAQKQFDALVKELSADLKKAEKRGATARTKAERELKKNRTKVERELRTRRAKAEQDLKRNRTRAEKEIKAFRADLDKQVGGFRKDIEPRIELVTTTVDNVVATGRKTATDAANVVVERVAALA